MQKNRSVPDVQRKRSQWIETISGANAEHQIYLDESGKTACSWHAIQQLLYIKQGWEAWFSGLPPLHIIEESYLQTFSHSLSGI